MLNYRTLSQEQYNNFVLRLIKMSLVVVFFSFTNFSMGQGSLTESLPDCHTDQSTENFCAKNNFDITEKKLNNIYKKKFLELKNKKNKDQLRIAQQAWINFRNKDCIYQSGGKQNEVGSSWALDYFSCMDIHAQQRIIELNKYLECTYNGCPM